MKVVGKRYIPAKSWFGNLEKDPKPAKFDATELEKVMFKFVKESRNA